MTYANAKQKAQHLANVSGQSTLVYKSQISTHGFNFGFVVPIWGEPIWEPRIFPKFIASIEGE
jgi:hypothetical protein